MEAVTLPVEERTGAKGSSSARGLRREGKIPGVVYGKMSDTVNVVIADDQLRRVLRHGQNVLLQLEYQQGEGPGRKQYAVVKDVQRDSLRSLFLSIDLHEVYLDVEIESPVPVEVVGEAEGVKNGGILSQLVHEVMVRALPGKMPPKVQVDVSTLDVGYNVRVAELGTSSDYVVVTDPDEVIATVLAPKLAPVEAKAPAEAMEAMEEAAEEDQAREEV